MLKYLPVMILTLLSACGEVTVEPNATVVTYNVDPSRITVSGISSGAYMAGQLHIAHSAVFSGVAMIGGGPYYCAMGDISRGLGPCMQGGEMSEGALLEYAHAALGEGKIDDLANLQNDRAWIFHGALDVVVDQAPSEIAAAVYTDLMPADSVSLITNVDAVHGLPTIETGLPCDSYGSPFLNSCGYDSAGEILRTLYGHLQARASTASDLLSVTQPGFDDAEMLENAFLYVPQSCGAGEACGVHVVFHGCSQSSESVDDAFAAGAGFNEWAETNNLLVLYPQVASSSVAPMNPYGCWDWWGYTNEDYATRSGPQIAVVKALLDALAGSTL